METGNRSVSRFTWSHTCPTLFYYNQLPSFKIFMEIILSKHKNSNTNINRKLSLELYNDLIIFCDLIYSSLFRYISSPISAFLWHQRSFLSDPVLGKWFEMSVNLISYLYQNPFPESTMSLQILSLYERIIWDPNHLSFGKLSWLNSLTRIFLVCFMLIWI